MTDRDRILAALPIGDLSAEAPSLPKAAAEASWEKFCGRLSALRGEVVSGGFAALTQMRAVVDFDVPPDIRSQFPNQTADVWEAELGVTMADAVVCETGSILIRDTPSRRRLASLVPERHLCLVAEDRIAPTLAEAIALVGRENAVLISGPSRTADIEGVMILGIHGPRMLMVAKVSDFLEERLALRDR